MGLVLCLCRDHLPKEQDHRVSLANLANKLMRIWMFIGYITRKTLIQGQLTENFTNSKARSISSNADMVF